MRRDLIVYSGILILCAMLLLQCRQKDRKHKRSEKHYGNLTEGVSYRSVHDAAYGYHYAIPNHFTRREDEVVQVDSSVYYSDDSAAVLRYFVVGEMKRSGDYRSLLRAYFEQIKGGKHPFLKGSTVVQSLLFKGKYDGYGDYFVVIGGLDSVEFVWKTTLGEVPISGDMTFKNMLFCYPKKQRKIYAAMGIELSRLFGDF